MLQSKQVYFWILVFLGLTFSCFDSDNEHLAKKIFHNEYLKELSVGWKITQSVDSVVEFEQIDNQGLKTGESFFFEFSKAKYIDYFEFVSKELPSFTCKIFLNGKYAGTIETNKKIGIRKRASSVRVAIVKKGNERVVKGWDRNYDYTFVKDTSTIANQKLVVKLQNDESTYFKEPVKRRSLLGNSIKAINSFDFIDKNCILYVTGKKNNNIIEQAAGFKSNGTFYVSYIEAQKNSKKLIRDYFLQGSWKPLKLHKNTTKIELEGVFSGKLDKKNQHEVFLYHKILHVDSLNIIRSNDFLNGLMLDLPNWVMVDLRQFNNDFIIDIPYATTNNITGKKLYECNECYLLYQTVKDLLRAQEMFRQKGFRVKMLDCYRPYDVQKILYDAFPVSGYVADPVGGSIHNRGTAVDLTLVDSNGNELDMGSEFDELSIRSNHGYTSFSDTIIQNRKLLRETMNACNFVTIRLEWWHYNHQFARKYPKLNDRFPCDN